MLFRSEVTLEEMAKSRPKPAPATEPTPAPTADTSAEHSHDSPAATYGADSDASHDAEADAPAARTPYPSELDPGHTEIDSNNSGHGDVGDIGAAAEPAPAPVLDDAHKTH